MASDLTTWLAARKAQEKQATPRPWRARWMEDAPTGQIMAEKGAQLLAVREHREFRSGKTHGIQNQDLVVSLRNEAPAMLAVIEAAARQEHIDDEDGSVTHVYGDNLAGYCCSLCAALTRLTEED